MVVQHEDRNLEQKSYSKSFDSNTNRESIIGYFHSRWFVDYDWKESEQNVCLSFSFKEIFSTERTFAVIVGVAVEDGEFSLGFKIWYKYRVNSLNGRGISLILHVRNRHAVATNYNG